MQSETRDAKYVALRLAESTIVGTAQLHYFNVQYQYSVGREPRSCAEQESSYVINDVIYLLSIVKADR